jgi:Ras-related protein Rab-1A
MEKNSKLETKIIEDFKIFTSEFPPPNLNFKIIVIGNSGVGKTCLTVRGTKGIFDESQIPTIGFEFFSFVVEYKDKVIKLDVWDTCGQEEYRSLMKSFFLGSNLVIIVYAINK